MFHFMFVHYTFSSVWVADWLSRNSANIYMYRLKGYSIYIIMYIICALSDTLQTVNYLITLSLLMTQTVKNL